MIYIILIYVTQSSSLAKPFNTGGFARQPLSLLESTYWEPGR